MLDNILRHGSFLRRAVLGAVILVVTGLHQGSEPFIARMLSNAHASTGQDIVVVNGGDDARHLRLLHLRS